MLTYLAYFSRYLLSRIVTSWCHH